jgi:hypothetical protein
MSQPNLVCSFDLIPGLVIDLLGAPAIVLDNQRNSDTEVATITLDREGVTHTLDVSWAQASTINVIGVTVDLQPDNIVLFNS